MRNTKKVSEDLHKKSCNLKTQNLKSFVFYFFVLFEKLKKINFY